MNTDLESKIQAKQIELEEAQKIVDKYSATVPLISQVEPIGYNMHEMKRDYDNYNKIRDEYMSLIRQRRDSR